MEKQTRHYDITVTGRVQGVGFRYFVMKNATALGIAGFVKNMPDGSVYIEAEGEKDKLNLFLDQCRRGPSWSRVDNVTWHEAPPASFNSFSIR